MPFSNGGFELVVNLHLQDSPGPDSSHPLSACCPRDREARPYVRDGLRPVMSG